MAQIRERPKELSNNNSPGPGYYQANHDAVKDKVVTYDMGKASSKGVFNQSNDKDGSPGPGHYD